MPVYEYRCDHGHVTDIHRSPDEASQPVTCPECGQPAQRLYKLRGIGFKGPGFHSTDYPHPRHVAGQD